jgi:ABC-type phosphate transport system substrate-binding protein
MKDLNASLCEWVLIGNMNTYFSMRLLRRYLLAALLFSATNLYAEVLVVVGMKNNLTALTKIQVKDVFLGRITSFPNGNAAIPIDQPENLSLREEFYLKVTSQTAAQVKAHWAKLYFTGRGVPPKEGTNSNEIKKLLNAIPASIAYIEKAALDDTVKVIFTVP